MTDTTDYQVLNNTINSAIFQARCRYRWLIAASQVAAESPVQLTANGATPAGSVLGTNNVLHFASTTGIVQGMTASDFFGAAIVPAGTIVESVTATTVTLNNFVAGAGVASGDAINFAPINHAQRMAFAGALYAGNVDLTMLAMVVLALPQNVTDCLAAPSVPGGNITTPNMDSQITGTFSGISLSRSW